MPETLRTAMMQSDEPRTGADSVDALPPYLLQSQCFVAFDLWEQRCSYVSPAMERLLGYPVEQLSPRTLHEAIHPDDLGPVARATSLAAKFTQHCAIAGPAMQASTPFVIDYRIKHRDGHYLRVLRQNFMLSYTYSAMGQPIITGSLFTDLSFHKKTLDVSFRVDHPAFAQWLHSQEQEHATQLLSTREQEILARVLAGESSVDIAKGLSISIHTVKTHRRNIQHKIQSHDVSQLLSHLDSGFTDNTL
jgi:DNA-binding CsgD family transcriptional regulator